jgi:hypothetical protein
MIHAFDVDLFAKTIAALVARADLLVLVGRHVIVAVEIDVASDADMLRAGELDDVIEVIERVFDRCWFAVAHEHAHAGDAHDASARSGEWRRPPYYGMVWHERAALGRDEHWLLEISNDRARCDRRSVRTSAMPTRLFADDPQLKSQIPRRAAP